MTMEECLKCFGARDSVDSWMEHLATCHPIPTEWPSDKVDRLTGPGLLKPYTTITESKKKRKKDVIPRPLNSFMIFAQHMRRNILLLFTEASNSDISKQLGRIWQAISTNVKTQYNAEASRLTKIHLKEFPNYKYQPKKKLKPGQQPSQPHLNQQHQIQNNNNNKNNFNSGLVGNQINTFQYMDRNDHHMIPQVMPLTVKTTVDSPMDQIDTKCYSYQYSFSPENVSGYLPLTSLPSLIANTDMHSTSSSYQVHPSYNQLISGGLPCTVSPLQPAQSPSMPLLTHASSGASLVRSVESSTNSKLLASVYSLAADYQTNVNGHTNFLEPLMTNFSDLPTETASGINLQRIREATNSVLLKRESHIQPDDRFSLDSQILLKEELNCGGGNNNLVQTPSSIQSDDLLNIPTSVLNDETNYEEQFGSIFPDQLPNLNSWVTSGNFI